MVDTAQHSRYNIKWKTTWPQLVYDPNNISFNISESGMHTHSSYSTLWKYQKKKNGIYVVELASSVENINID